METNKKIRPVLTNLSLNLSENEAEYFQNKVLRPIIKLQSDLILAHLNAKLQGLKIQINELNEKKKKEILKSIFSKDLAHKREVIGIIIGQFELEEFQTYSEMSKEINKRIIQISLNRCLDLI